ncbi:MAG: hypothetical protein AVDCRST_MAG08-4507, partial [uncultured Acetobacteraceae bacterium]
GADRSPSASQSVAARSTIKPRWRTPCNQSGFRASGGCGLATARSKANPGAGRAQAV